jgi:transcriptional regulator with XRE-family HTH domain
MIVGDRLKAIREAKNLSQGDIEKRTGLLRCYISRVENGHTVPAIETLEKMARAMEVPVYQLFYDGDERPKALKLPEAKATKISPKDARVLSRLGTLLGSMKDRDKTLLVGVARKLSAAR